MCRKPETVKGTLAEQAMQEVEAKLTGEQKKIHMDLSSDTDHLPKDILILRAARFFGYLIAFMGVMWVIGLVPTVVVFVIFFMRYENSERWKLVIPYTAVLVFLITFIFDNIMAIPWPPTLIGEWFPILKFLPSI
jgi:hypothetical protein